jgi:acetylornithine deacetylase
MDVVRFTRELVDIESVTGNERRVGEFLEQRLRELGFQTERMPVVADRFNVVAVPPGQPRPPIFFSTHMDTVPPFIPSSEDDARAYGRGACDAKGIIAAQVAAAVRLRCIGLLFVVGEERDSQGAVAANQNPRGARFLINGEPTENRLAVASKGSLRLEIIAQGRMAHSAYPELGESAIEKLLEALNRVRAIPLPSVDGIGAATLNIGTIAGGRAPNVVPDQARAELIIRLVGESVELKRQIVAACDGLAEVKFGLEVPFVRLRTVGGLPTMVAAFTTDIPVLSNWGEPLLLGPGSIHVAHTDGEYVAKRQLLEAVDLYCELVRKL